MSNAATTAAPAGGKRRALGQQVPFEGENGLYTQSWFPICLSSDIPAGTVKGFPFLGGRVVAFRDESGVAQVTSAYCAHLGADLSLGKVVGSTLQCPYHFWEYDRTGACRKTGVGDPPPRHASLYAFPTCEKHGLIWAFNGETPMFDIPDWPLAADTLLTDTQLFPVEMPVDPWIICAQTPDIQHIIQLHKFELLGKSPYESVAWTDYTMSYDLHARAQGRVMDVRASIIGSSLFYQTGTLDGRWFGFLVAMGLPGPSRTSLFSVLAAQRGDGDGDEAEVRQFIEEARHHEIAIASEDSDIAASIHFRVGALTKADAVLAEFLRRMCVYPRANPAAEFIC